jgi:glycerophosphoryl diester phosphodiesterase
VPSVDSLDRGDEMNEAIETGRGRRPAGALLAIGVAIALVVPAREAAAYNTLDGAAPIVIAHRGASGYRPEHTLAGYLLAIQLGANYIEPDLVLTKDGQLIVRHEPMLDGTTDVASKFDASRRSTRMLDGVATTAYFASDFTLAEIKTLRAIQPVATRDQSYNGQFEIPTLTEVIALAQSQSASLGRTIGIYPEIKHSTFHASLFGAHVIEDKALSTLHAAYGNTAQAPVFIQSFEVGNLQYLNGLTQMRLVQLIDADDVKADGSLSLVNPYRQPYDLLLGGDPRTFADLLTPEGLAFVKTYADGVGPWKPYLVRTVADGVDRNLDGSYRDRRSSCRRQHRRDRGGAPGGTAGPQLHLPQRLRRLWLHRPGRRDGVLHAARGRWRVHRLHGRRRRRSGSHPGAGGLCPDAAGPRGDRNGRKTTAGGRLGGCPSEHCSISRQTVLKLDHLVVVARTLLEGVAHVQSCVARIETPAGVKELF